MGDTKKHRKKYNTPNHPWQKERIEEEKALIKGYGLKNKKEIWKFTSMLKNFKAQAKKLVVSHSEQAEKEKENLLKRLYKYNLLEEGRGLASVLEISLKDVLERRLQTQLMRKGLARTVRQARQMITHSHIMVGDMKIDAPSYLVTVQEENRIAFAPNSNFFDAEHPERSGESKPKLSKGKQEVDKTSVAKPKAPVKEGKIEAKPEKAEVKEPEKEEEAHAKEVSKEKKDE